MNTCLCCDSLLLRHIYKEKISWFCCRCRQEMPNFDEKNLIKARQKINLKKIAPLNSDQILYGELTDCFISN
jgi:hypothetical protein